MAARAALAALSVLVLVFAVALGSSRSLARVGGPGHLLRPQLIAGDLGIGFAVLALAVLGLLVYALWPGRRRKRRDDEPEWVVEQLPVPWWEKLLLMAFAFLPLAALVTALVFVAHRAGQRTAPLPTPVPTATIPGQGAHSGSPVVPGGPATAVHWWVWGALAGLAAVAMLIFAVRRRLTRTRASQMPEPEPRWLPTAIEESIAEIEQEADPRRAVVRAYVSMERAFARHGLARRPFEAPREYLARALTTSRVSRPAGERLTSLFQRARFSEHQIPARVKADAIGALKTVRDELTEHQQ